MSKHGSSGGSGSKGSGGKPSGGGKSGGTPLTQSDASRIQSAGDRHPENRTSQTDFGSRAQSAGDRNANAQKG